MRLGDLPWTHVRDALAETDARCVAVLPCGAVEAHGPHLPLLTDVVISEAFAEAAARMLNGDGLTAYVLPALAYAPAEYASAFPGTIGLRAETAIATLLDIAASLKAQGFACLAIANSHFDPTNVAMLREAVLEIERLGLPVAFPDFTRRALAQTLGEEFVSGACHAGQFETSIVMAARPDLVDETARANLAPNARSLVEAMTRGAKTFHEAGGAEAYFGAPADASGREGEATIALMAAALANAVRQACTQTPGC
jgi:creatinine amidohydrolase